MVAWINEAVGGTPAALVPQRKWAAMLTQACANGNGGNPNPLARFVTLFDAGSSGGVSEEEEEMPSHELVADTVNTDTAVLDTDAMPCPEITRELVRMYVDSFSKLGLVHPKCT